MDILMERLNGAIDKMYNHGIFVTKITPSSPEIREYVSEAEGRDGDTDYGADYGMKTVAVSFVCEAYDNLDIPLKRDEILSLLGKKEKLYIYEGRETGEAYGFERPGELPFTDEAGNPRSFDFFKDIEHEYIYGKRYLVRNTGAITLEEPDQGRLLQGEIIYKVVGQPYGQSAATTQTPLVIGNTGDPMQDSIWTLGGPEIFEDPNKLKYNWNANDTIWIYNGGDVPIDPCQMPLRMEYRGNSTNLRIRNLTNGTEWFRSKPGNTASSDHFVIDGIESFRNGLDIVHETNYNLLELEPGWNQIQLTGANSAGTISFDFRWYFL